MKPMNALERAIQNRSNQSLEQIALQFEPLAQAMAALTDETRETLESIQTSAREQADEMALLGQKGARQWQTTCQTIEKAAQGLLKASEASQRASRRQGWQTWLMVAMVTAIASLGAPTAYVTWQQEYSEEAKLRADQAQSWAIFQEKYQALTPADQRRVKEILKW